MKTKYILENYDRIIFAIKNPKIIFSNDLIPYLKNFTSDSYLIHPVDFNIQNSEVKYSVNQPIHNLHPSACQIKTKDFLLKPELDHYFPQIVKELHIPNNQASWHWCQNNKNRAYIFQDFEIENLTQEQRFFLYCYHTVKKENFIIKKINKEIIFKLNSKAKIEQYINQIQSALQNLTNGILKEFSPEHPAELNQFSTNCDQIDCFKITYIYLEKLYQFIENEYKTYINLNYQIPLCSTFIKDFKFSKKLTKVKTALSKSNINDQLLKVLKEPLLKIEHFTNNSNLTYFEFNFCSEIINELHNQIKSDIVTEEAILDCLFDLNYNSLQLFKYITGAILKEVEPFEYNKEKRNEYFRILKIYNQKISRNTLKYKKNLPSIKKQITAWIEEEIEYLNKIIKEEKNQVEGAPMLENNIKFLTDLSVAQIAFLIKILVEAKIIDHQILAEVIRFIARHFKTKKTDTIAVESLRTKYHNVESATKIVVGNKLVKMLKFTEN